MIAPAPGRQLQPDEMPVELDGPESRVPAFREHEALDRFRDDHHVARLETMRESSGDRAELMGEFNEMHPDADYERVERQLAVNNNEIDRNLAVRERAASEDGIFKKTGKWMKDHPVLTAAGVVGASLLLSGQIDGMFKSISNMAEKHAGNAVGKAAELMESHDVIGGAGVLGDVPPSIDAPLPMDG